ncbi:MAG: NAD(P)-dependent oxidoreductase [Alphaproteobacteria bacterium]|nr:NAD(P)-dependent oxidoreductase [Alphaproteobacteria bacterium]
MRILVTGGTGFIGRHAVSALMDAGHEVIVLSRTCVAGAASICGDIVKPDVALLEAVRSCGADAMLALAWETTHGKFWHASSNAAWCASMIQLVDAFLAGGGKRVVCAGTCVEYDPPIEGACKVEETPISPTFPYSISKDAFHRMLVWITAARGATYAWGRIFLAYGPDEQAGRLVPSIIRSVMDGKPAECSSGKQRRDFLHAVDYGRAFAALTASDFHGPINICAGEPVTIAQVVQKIGDLMGRPDLIKLGALPDRPNEPQNLWGDVTPLHNAIGFTPSYSLKEGLTHVIDWWGRQAQNQ